MKAQKDSEMIFTYSRLRYEIEVNDMIICIPTEVAQSV
jgi:hypothetical protein